MNDSDRHAFALAVRKTMESRHISERALAAAIGTSSTAIHQYRRGTVLPTVKNAAKLADALLEPDILSMVVAARTRPCRVCRKPITDEGNKRRLFCSIQCNRLQVKGVTATPNIPDVRAQAIAKFCNHCEPAGVCRTFQCELRPVSPLPFVPLVSVTVAERRDIWSAERRSATSKRSLEMWRRRREAVA